MKWLFPLCLLFLGCHSEVVEQARVPNPTGSLDAVLALRLNHATVPNTHEVFIVPSGQSLAKEEDFEGAAFRCTQGDGVELNWTRYNRLEVKTKTREIWGQETLWQLPDSRLVTLDYSVEAQSRP